MRLTAELIGAAAVYMNPLRQREINLRGFKIGHIENLGVTNDEYEVIDLSDNELSRVENLPLLRRLTTLLLGNNQLTAIDPAIASNLPSLDSLVLSHNRFSTLASLTPLALLPRLRHLSLLHCPVTRLSGYRSWLLHLCPNLHTLDFSKVKPAERDAALREHGPPPTLESLERERMAAMQRPPAEEEKPLPGQAVPSGTAVSLTTTYAQPTSFAATATPKLSADELAAEKKRLMSAIAAAASLDEVTALQKELDTLIANNS